jgi:hypothetical protein
MVNFHFTPGELNLESVNLSLAKATLTQVSEYFWRDRFLPSSAKIVIVESPSLFTYRIVFRC